MISTQFLEAAVSDTCMWHLVFHSDSLCDMTVQFSRSNRAMLLCGKDPDFHPKVFATGLKIPLCNPLQNSSANKVHNLCVTMHQWNEDVGIGASNSTSFPWDKPPVERCPFRKCSIHIHALLINPSKLPMPAKHQRHDSAQFERVLVDHTPMGITAYCKRLLPSHHTVCKHENLENYVIRSITAHADPTFKPKQQRRRSEGSWCTETETYL